MRKHLLAWTALLAVTCSARAATDTYTFETDTPRQYSPLRGKGAEGSTLEISAEKAHEGKQSLKLSYQSTGGWIEFSPSNTKKLFTADRLYLAFWVYGEGKKNFSAAAVRLQDNNGEAFQFDVPGFADAMAGDGWREVRAELDLTKTKIFWGQTSDGIVDKPVGWFGLAATRASETPQSGVIYIDDLRLSDEPIPASRVAAAPQAPGPGQNPEPAPYTLTAAPVMAPTTGHAAEFLKWTFPPGQDVRFRAQVTLRTPAQGHFLLWKALDAFDTRVAGGRIALEDGTTEKSAEIRVPQPPRGVLYLTVSLSNAREEVLTSATSRAAIFTPRERPVPATPFIWGVAAHPSRNGGRDADAEIALMRLLGFSAARFDLLWNDIQPSATEWNWTKYDRLMAAFAREGITPAPILSYGTKWATTGDANSKDWHQWNNTPPRTEAYVNYAREAVKRYGNQTRYWEIWNEPDIDFWLGSVEQYTALVNAVVPAIKAVQPNARIMNGGFTETRRRPDFIPTYLKTVQARPDIYAFHTHMHFQNLIRAEMGTRERLQAAGWTGKDAPEIWLNESGFSNHRDTPELEQAAQLVKKMTYASSAGFKAYIWYDLRDDGTDAHELEHNFGLVKRDFRPKAAAVAANVLMGYLAGCQSDGRLDLGDNVYAPVHRGQGRTVLTAWRLPHGTTTTGIPLLLRAKGPDNAPVRLQSSDIFGNVTPLETRDGLFVLPLGTTPAYILAPQENVRFEPVGQMGKLLDFAPKIVLTPGVNQTLPITIANPFASPLRGQLTVSGAAALPVEVPAGASRTYTLPVTLSLPSGMHQPFNVTLQSPDLPAPLRAAGEYQMAYIIPRAPQSLEIALPQGNLVSLFEATPMQDLHFKGPQDLSAKVKFQQTARGTQVEVTVTDQTHSVNTNQGTMWQGDSIQWAISLSDGSFYEWTAALLPTGPTMGPSIMPDSVKPNNDVEITREGNLTTYRWLLPKSTIGGHVVSSPVAFNFIINDNDGTDRKGWLEWAPGIGREKNPRFFPQLALAP